MADAQPALETAARFLAPELLAFAANVDDEDETSSPRSKSDVDALLAGAYESMCVVVTTACMVLVVAFVTCE